MPFFHKLARIFQILHQSESPDSALSATVNLQDATRQRKAFVPEFLSYRKKIEWMKQGDRRFTQICVDLQLEEGERQFVMHANAKATGATKARA